MYCHIWPPDALTAAFDVDEYRLRGKVTIPDVMVDDLAVPGDFATRAAQRYNRVGVTVISGSRAAKEVRRSAGGRQKP
jgi:hypothetical protein